MYFLQRTESAIKESHEKNPELKNTVINIPGGLNSILNTAGDGSEENFKPEVQRESNTTKQDI